MPEWKPEILKRLSSTNLSPARESEIADELAQHLDDRYYDLISNGTSESDAHARALQELSLGEIIRNELIVTEVLELREQSASSLNALHRIFESISRDFLFALRACAKSPGFTLLAVFTLAIGIGANTALFSVVYGVLLRPLPFFEQDRLVVAWEKDISANAPFVELSAAEFLDWKAQNTSFSSLAVMPTTSYGYGYVLTGKGEPIQLESSKVTGQFFSTLGTTAELGRVLDESDDKPGGPPVVVISDRLWRETLGGDPNVVGKVINLNNTPFMVVGVMPAKFEFPREVDLWIPLIAVSNPKSIANRGAVYLQAVGRLKPGVTVERAQADLDTIIARVAAEHPDTQAEGHRVVITPLAEHLFGNSKPALWALFGATALLLIIAAANTANLLLARATSRRKELAIRAALGAGRWKLISPLLSERIVLAIGGSTVGILFAKLLISLIVRIAPLDIPRIEDIGLNKQAFLLCLICTISVSVIFGLLPALTASRFNLNEVLNEGSSRLAGSKIGNRLRAFLIVGEIALTFILLAGASLILHSFINLNHVPLGFDPNNVLTMQLRLTGERYGNVDTRRAFFQQLIERIESHPGIIAASGVLIRPLEGTVGWEATYGLAGQSTEEIKRNTVANYETITPHYFRTLGIPLKAGKEFDSHDTSDTEPVTIISESLANRLFGSARDAVGKRLRLFPEPDDGPGRLIVGVAGNVRYREIQSTRLDIYAAHAQTGQSLNHFAVRSALPSDETLSLVRREVAALDPDLAVSHVATMNELVAQQMARPRFSSTLLNCLAGMALFLAGCGIFGVIAYSVAQRTNELGLRIALGAQASDIAKIVLTQGVKLALIGMALGAVGAVFVTRWIENLLFGVSAGDPVTFVTISLLVLIVSILACYIPARRATKVDPMIALRSE